ncbi:MAG TPA: transglycosylase SLT domain-containing protein [Caldimonas sp.]|nr:transglycosylase SLT domain-containing protein [Caldimonas sp.]
MASAPEDAASEPAQATAADPLRPDVHVDLDDRSTRIDLWARVRSGFTMPDLDNDLVREQERWYRDRPDYVQRMMERGSRYLFHIVEELDRRQMPMELALLPFIESAYNPQAMSVAKASGMWQFIPSTGRNFELKQNVFRDDRRDVLASTRAALDYLNKLYGMFGDWQLALAAYNWGEGNVQRAVARNQRAGLATDYASLRMPYETAHYLPKLQAVKNIVLHPEVYNLALPELSNHPYFLTVSIERDIDVALAARIAGMELEEFHQLNPQMNKPVILAAGTPQILLPYDNANRFVRQLPQHNGPLASWTAWIAPRTMKTADAARAAGMPEDQLREVNRIPAHMLVKAGSTLVVPRNPARTQDVSVAVADNAVMALAPDAPPARRTTLKAGRHDTVATVARRYRLNPAQVAQWNGVTPNASFRPGQTVVVWTAPKVRVASSEAAPASRPHAARHVAPSKQQHVVATTHGGHVARASAPHGAGKSTASKKAVNVART